jgi:hypothetical protein
VTAQLFRDVCNHTSSTDAYECRPDSHLPFAQLLWWRSNIVFNPDIFLAVVSCGSHLAMFLRKARGDKGRQYRFPWTTCNEL